MRESKASPAVASSRRIGAVNGIVRAMKWLRRDDLKRISSAFAARLRALGLGVFVTFSQRFRRLLPRGAQQ